jgi:hypothetical protein
MKFRALEGCGPILSEMGKEGIPKMINRGFRTI